MLDERKKAALQAFASILLDWCEGDVAAIRIHADVCDDMPCMLVTVGGYDYWDEDSEPLWRWEEFPESEEDE